MDANISIECKHASLHFIKSYITPIRQNIKNTAQDAKHINIYDLTTIARAILAHIKQIIDKLTIEYENTEKILNIKRRKELIDIVNYQYASLDHTINEYYDLINSIGLNYYLVRELQLDIHKRTNVITYAKNSAECSLWWNGDNANQLSMQ